MEKEHFASYLEELAAEIRAFTLTRTYLDDAQRSLQDLSEKFFADAYEKCRVRVL